MNFKQIYIMALSVLWMSFGLPENIQKKVDSEIKEVFRVVKFEFKSVIISSEVTNILPSDFSENNFFEIKNERTLVGYAYVSKAVSKTDEFDYLVLFDSDLIVKKAKVLVYREDYGGEIGSKRWLKQFIGKSPNDELKYGDNIAAISGATISVKSMTLAINNLLQSIKILHEKNII